MPTAFAAALLASITALAAPARADTLVIRGAAIVDVRTGELIQNRDIRIEDGRITALIPAGAPAEGQVIDATGLFAMPGLFDAHVHLMASMDTDPKLLIAHGVTSARDLGAPTQPILDLKKSIASGGSGGTLGPDLVVTGAIIDGDPPMWPFSEIAADADAGRAAVRKLHDAGVDMIKVYSRLTKDAYLAVVDEAHKHNLKVTGHIPESVTLSEAIAAGQDCNEHLMRIDAAIAALAGQDERRNRPMTQSLAGWAFYDDVPQEKLEAWAKSLAAGGMMQCPTIIVMKGIGRSADPEAKNDPMLAYVTGPTREFWSSEVYSNWGKYAGAIVPTLQKTVRLFHDNGVPMMIGTDLGNPYVFAGRAVHDEMALWQDAGIPAPDILRAATIVPATFCNLADSHGSIDQGKTANIVLLRKNPLTDIHNAAEIEHVILRGVHYDRAALDGIIEGVRKKIADESTAPPKQDDAPVAANLPGNEVARGVFRMTFGKFDAGAEHFVITETDDAYHLFADLRPKGGGQTPSTITARASKGGRPQTVQWNQRTAPPVNSTYTIDGDTLTATATKGGEPQPRQTVALTDTHILSIPAIASTFLENRALALQPGETRQLTVLSFGFPDWRTQPSPYKVTRNEDTTIDLNGVETKCAHYITVTTTPMGPFKTESWVDDNFLPHRAVLTMPFGVVTFIRE